MTACSTGGSSVLELTGKTTAWCWCWSPGFRVFSTGTSVVVVLTVDEWFATDSNLLYFCDRV